MWGRGYAVWGLWGAMVASKDLNPSDGPLAFFGSELRRLRVEAGWTQEQLGDEINYSAALVGMVETARRMPSRDFAEACDRAFDTGGLLVRMWPLVRKEAYPTWFRPFVDLEREAHTLRSWELAVVPGLLQTTEYARELLRSWPGTTEGQVEEMVAARIERQTILASDRPPLMWFVMDEGVLHRPIGDPEIMRGQLQALVEASPHSHVKIQLVPRSAGAHPGVLGAFAIASFDRAPDVAFLASAGEGHVTDYPAEVRSVASVYDTIRTEALPVGASLDLITKVIEQWT